MAIDVKQPNKGIGTTALDSSMALSINAALPLMDAEEEEAFLEEVYLNAKIKEQNELHKNPSNTISSDELNFHD